MSSFVGATVDPAAARTEARHILGGRRYRGSPVPRPLHGVLRWIGDRTSTVTHWIGDRFSWLPKPAVPWVQAAALIFVALVVVAIVRAVATARANARAARVGEQGTGGPDSAPDDDPRALETAADAAEARGDLALAVRLRFRAGLLRLDRDAHAITYRPSIPTVAVRSEVASPEFDALADAFESITYGSAPADPAATEDARRQWPKVVASAKRR